MREERTPVNNSISYRAREKDGPRLREVIVVQQIIKTLDFQYTC